MKKTCPVWRVHHYTRKECFVRFTKRLETSLPVFERHLGSKPEGIFVRRHVDETLAARRGKDCIQVFHGHTSNSFLFVGGEFVRHLEILGIQGVFFLGRRVHCLGCEVIMVSVSIVSWIVGTIRHGNLLGKRWVHKYQKASPASVIAVGARALGSGTG